VTIKPVCELAKVAELKGDFGEYQIRDMMPIDGDTVAASVLVRFIDVDVVLHGQRIRVTFPDGGYYNSPELTGVTRVSGLLAKAELEELLKAHGRQGSWKCLGRDKYGRYLGPITIGEKDVAEHMEGKGHHVAK
jgi:endonuclease YncB( thermonuclease family)